MPCIHISYPCWPSLCPFSRAATRKQRHHRQDTPLIEGHRKDHPEGRRLHRPHRLHREGATVTVRHVPSGGDERG